MIKKKCFKLLVLCLAISLFMATVPVYASDFDYTTYLTLQIDNPNVHNGIYSMTFPLDYEDESVKPLLYNERTMLPLRAVTSVLNFDGPMFYDIEWNAEENSALIYLVDDSDPDFYQAIAKFYIDNTTAEFFKDGLPYDVSIPVAPTLINNRTYLPLRAIVDALTAIDNGFVTSIEWVDSRQGIVICLYGAKPSAVTFPDGTSAKLF